MKKIFLIIAILLPLSLMAQTQEDFEKIVQPILETEWNKKLIPGGIIWVANQKGEPLYKKMFGAQEIDLIPLNKVKKISEIPVQENTIYDLASISKIYTATAIGLLVDQGKIKYTDLVSNYIDAFKTEEKKQITITHLLTHSSGLAPVNSLADLDSARYTKEEMWENVFNTKMSAEVGEKFIYSDIGYMTLSRIVEKVAEKPFASFVEESIFKPLKLEDTYFYPSEALFDRLAPTIPNQLKGIPHDPRARLIGGAAGHAGVFATMPDLAKFMSIFLDDGQELLKKETVAQMTSVAGDAIRALGFDVLSPYADSLRGEIIPKESSFGHSGYTGTSVWLEKGQGIMILILTNRVYYGDSLKGKRNLIALRRAIATEIGKLYFPVTEPDSSK